MMIPHEDVSLMTINNYQQALKNFATASRLYRKKLVLLLFIYSFLSQRIM